MGGFSYFNNNLVLSSSQNKTVKNDARAVFYRPSTKQILYYDYNDVPNLSTKVFFPCDTLEESANYISNIKAIYEKWQKKQKK